MSKHTLSSKISFKIHVLIKYFLRLQSFNLLFALFFLYWLNLSRELMAHRHFKKSKLRKKSLNWYYQIILKVKVIMSHIWLNENFRMARAAVLLQINRVLKHNKLIFHPMNKKTWRLYFRNKLQVVELLWDQGRQEIEVFINNWLNVFECAH